MTTLSTSSIAPNTRSRLHTRIGLTGFAAAGLAALAWAAFVPPLPRLTYNPSDSVAVGWYRIEPFSHRAAWLPHPLTVDSIVLVPLPTEAAALAAQRGYRSRKQARSDVFDYIERFYNPTRRHSTLGYISPIEFEEAREA